MNKKIRKTLSLLLPSGKIKEKVKLFYYNLISPKNVKFAILYDNDDEKKHITKYNNITIITQEALYPVIPDFDYYQHFYKVKKNDIIIDAGANCGHLSILFSKIIGQNGNVFAFEPDMFNIERINKNLLNNKDLEQNITIEDLLLWNENTYINFYESGTVGSSAIWIPNGVDATKKEAITIDSWATKKGLNKLDFIKMDIEGAEIEALEGATEIIKKFNPNFAIASYHYVNNEQTYIKVEEFFKKLNYPFKTIKFRGTEIITFAGPACK